MNLKLVLGNALLVAGLVAITPAALAESVVLEQTNVRANAGPARGLSMAQVEKRYGAPKAKLAPAGGDSAVHPVINRWQYDGFTVYFERETVIHSVRNGG